MPGRGKTIAAMKAVNVKKKREIKDETDDETTIKYQLNLESEAQGVRAVITRDEPWDGVKAGMKLDIRIESTQMTLDVEEEK